MRVTAHMPPICFFTALALGLLALSHGSEVIAESPVPVQLMAQPSLVARPEPAPLPDSAMVWVEAVFVELDSKTTHHVEDALGFKLSPPDGKAILTAEEKEKLLAVIGKTEGARAVASLSVLTVSGQQAQSEDVEELTYPTEYDTETINVTGSGASVDVSRGEAFMVTPGNWEQRDLGTILNVTPTISENRRIALVLMPEVTMLVDWTNYGNEVYPIMQPVFRTWNKTTTVIIPDGSTFVLKESPLKPIYTSQLPAPRPPGSPIEPQEPVGKPGARRGEILRKLDVVIPEFKVENATLTEIVDYLSHEADVNIVVPPGGFADYGEGPPPMPVGIGMPGGPGAPLMEPTRINLSLKNVPLREVLKYVVESMNLKYLVEDYAILIVPKHYVAPAPPAPEPEAPKTLLTIISARIVE